MGLSRTWDDEWRPAETVFRQRAPGARAGDCRLSRACRWGTRGCSGFPTRSVSFQIDENIRGTDVFIVQPTCADVDRSIMELCVMIDAFRRSSASRITAVIPYYGYARQDRKDKPRVPISAKLVANLLSAAGTNRVLTMDLHKAQIQGFFDIPVDHLFAAPVIIDYCSRLAYPNLTIVSPDAGGAERARAYAKRLDADLAIIDKRRSDDGTAEVMNVVGDVTGQTCIIQDDIIDTAGTIVKAAHGAEGRTAPSACSPVRCTACCRARRSTRLEAAPIDQVIITNTIPLNGDRARCKKIKVLSVARLLGPGDSEHSRRDVGLFVVCVRAPSSSSFQLSARETTGRTNGSCSNGLEAGSWKLEADLWTQHFRQKSAKGGARTKRGGCARAAGFRPWSTAPRRARRSRSPSIPKMLLRILHSESGVNTLIGLQLDGGDTRVLVKEYQLDPIDHKLLHADFYQVAMDKTMTVTVPIVLKGEAKGVKQQGGIVDFVHREIEIEVLPGDIPENITVDISELMLHEGVRVRDLQTRGHQVEGDERRRHDDRPRRGAARRRSAGGGRAAAAAPAAPAEPEVIKKGKTDKDEDEKPEKKK